MVSSHSHSYITRFAYFKQKDLNPDNIRVTHKSFPNIVSLCYKRVHEMKKNSTVMLWHRIVLNLYHYMLLRKI